MIGQTISHYRITAKLGAGGMGEVYRATDTRLGRDVALKVLPPEMARNPERLARFQREARAVAALNHPHIVTIFSVEDADGVHFITMELVEGQSLDRLIPNQGLPLDRLVEIVAALAEALAAAHEKGIVHRDLKPANVMVADDGRVKVLDFGLAKDVRSDSSDAPTMTSDGHTQAGVVMGTPTYMSPEQVAGRVVDHRTDIFSLGILLYEMATGEQPFQGRSSAELASAILRDTPRPPGELRADLPGDLARVIRRCLEKDPRHRIQTARDVVNEFRDLARPASSKPSSTAPAAVRPAQAADSGAARAEEGFWVAVLPFKYSGANADVAALAEGLTEDVLAGLSRFSYLRVISRSSTASYAAQAVDVRAAGKALGARYVMEGSLRQAGAKLRLSVQLVDATTGAQLWTDTYNREVGEANPFEIQDDLTDHIVTTVADGYGVLVRSMASAIRDKPVEEASAAQLVLRYFAYMQQISPEEHARLRTGFERALEREPHHADAWACLAFLYCTEYLDRFNPREKPMERAHQAAQRAVNLDPACQLGWEQLAVTHFFARDFSAFRPAAERAISLNPRNGSTCALLAMLLAYSGEWDRGVALTAKIMALNPHHPGWYHCTAFMDYYRQGRYEEALQVAKKMNMPHFHWSHLQVAAACGQLNRQEEARAAIESLRKHSPTFLNVKNCREDIAKWFEDDALVELLAQGWRKAGLKESTEPSEPLLHGGGDA